MPEDNIEEKFSSLINKLQEVSLRLNETAKNIKDGLIPTFERSMADMQLAIDRLTSKNSQIIKKFEEQTNFLAENFRSSIEGVKAVFDINKFEDILKNSEKLNAMMGDQLKDLDISKVTSVLKNIVEKFEKKI
jgi:methyl-accepting chemotaxis protein